MALRGELLRHVTLGADLTALRFEFGAVRIMTIAAHDTFCVHPALLERGVVEHLVAHLAVVLEQIGRQEGRAIIIGETFARLPTLRELSASSVTRTASLDFIAERARHAVFRASSDRIGGPIRRRALCGDTGEAFVGQSRIARAGGPGDVPGRGAMTAFAADADFRESGVEPLG